MADSRQIAGLVGPTLVGLILSENQFVNPHLYDRQIPPVVYLSGTLFLIAGLSIVRGHNRWTRGWPVVVTIVGWFAILLGLLRMFAPAAYSRGAQANGGAFLIGELALLAIGVFLSFKAYTGKAGTQPVG